MVVEKKDFHFHRDEEKAESMDGVSSSSSYTEPETLQNDEKRCKKFVFYNKILLPGSEGGIRLKYCALCKLQKIINHSFTEAEAHALNLYTMDESYITGRGEPTDEQLVICVGGGKLHREGEQEVSFGASGKGVHSAVSRPDSKFLSTRYLQSSAEDRKRTRETLLRDLDDAREKRRRVARGGL